MSVRVDIAYEGDLHCTSTHAPSKTVLATDAPVDNQGRGASFSPTDLVGTALGTCMLTTMAIGAKKNNLAVDIAGAGARVVKHMTSTPPRRIARIEVELDIPAAADHPDRAQLEQFALQCPVALSLHPEVEKAVTFRWIG